MTKIQTESKAPRKRNTKGGGSIYQRKDGRYVAEIPAEMTGGKKKMIYAKTRKEAEKKRQEAIINVSKGVNLNAKKMTFGAYMEAHYTEFIVRNRAFGTQRSYRQNMDSHILPAFGKKPIDKIEVQDVQRFLNNLTDKGLSAQSVRIIHAALRATLNHALRARLITYNPASLVSPPKQVKKIREFLDLEDAKKLLEACKGHRWGVAVATCLMTGLRKGELLGLRWTDVNLADGVITVQNQLQRVKKEGKSQLVLLTPKSVASVRKLVLPESAKELLAQHRSLQRTIASSAKNWLETGFVFTSEVGTPVEPRNLNKAFNEIQMIASVSKSLRVHDLRHGTASLMLAEGVDLRTIMEILGHSQFSLTSDLYSHVMMSKKKEAAQKLGQAFA